MVVGNVVIPSVIERSGLGERAYDIYSRLLKDRIVFVGSAIDDNISNLVIAQLLFLDAEDPGKPIDVYINSPGGSLTAGLAIYDAMTYVHPPVRTICTGMAASAASLILAAGAPGMRLSLPHAQIMLHEPSGGSQGTASDIEIHAKEILRLRRTVHEIYARHCGRPIEQVEQDVERDFFMTPQQAKEWGLIDAIVEHAPRGQSPNGHVPVKLTELT